MSANLLKWLRGAVVTLLVLLVIQFEFGMAVNLSDLPSISPFGFSLPGVLSVLNQIGFVALFHAVLGTALTIFALITLVLALASKIRSVQILGVLGFVSMVLAAAMGLYFVLSGLQNDGYSHGMATNFILTFVFYFLEMYLLKPTAKARAN